MTNPEYKRLQLRRGSEAARASELPASGELILTTDNNELFAGDGSTYGGVAVNNYYIMDTVAIMKAASSRLKAGAKVKTLGYYAANDGGGALYRIITGSYTDDGGKYHQIGGNTNRFAELIVENNTINFKQLGGRCEQDTNYAHFDNKDRLLSYIALLGTGKTYDKCRIKLYIPSGIWCFSETCLYRLQGFHISGDESFTQYGVTYEGTIITALNDNQTHVWKIGGQSDYTHPSSGKLYTVNVIMKNLEFSTSLYSASGYVQVYSVKKAALVMDCVVFGFCEGQLSFSRIFGTALAISNCWEWTYNSLCFRTIGDHTKPCMLLDVGYGTPTINIDNHVVHSISFEQCNGDLIKSEMGSKVGEFVIGHFEFEELYWQNNKENVAPVSNSLTNYNLLDSSGYDVHEAVINGGALGGVTINAMHVNRLGAYSHTVNGVSYIRDRILNLDTVTGSPLRNIIIGSIVISENYFPLIVVYGRGTPVTYNFGYSSTVIINNIMLNMYANNNYPVFDVQYFGTIIVNNTINILMFDNKKFFGCTPCYEAQVKDQVCGGKLYSDSSAMNPLHIALKSTRYLGVGTDVFCSVPNLSGYNVKVRVKVPSGVTASLGFSGNENNVMTWGSTSIVGDGKYHWVTLSASAKDENTTLHISDSTSTTSYGSSSSSPPSTPSMMVDCFMYEKRA